MFFRPKRQCCRPLLLFALVTICVIQAAWAAPATDLLTAWHAARSYDAAFFAAQSADVAAQEKKAQGDALLAPQVSLIGSATQALQTYHPGDTTSRLPTNQSGQQYRAAVALSKPLYDASASIMREQLYKEAAQAEVVFRQAEQDLMLRTAKAYFEVLVAAESVNLLRTQKQAIAEQLDLAKESFDLGLMTASDVNDAHSRLDSIAATEIAGRNDLEAKQEVFRQITGLDPAQLAPMANIGQPEAPDPRTLNDWLSRAQAENLSIRSVQLSVEIAHRAIDRYTLRNSPVLTFVTSAGRSWDAGSISTSGGRDLTTNGTIGLQLSIPLYDGGGRTSRLRQAYALEDQQRYTLEATRRDTDRVTRFFFSGVRDSALRVRALEQARLSSAAAVESTQLGREVGVRTTIDVLNAQQTYYQTLLNLAAARYDYLFDRIQLAATAGALDEASLRDVNASIAKP